ncbi:fatty acid synthase-like [Harmonia axyridis]|uniref:fatty acid synthase-like n=1 Tax=Harmonia axyridis TaxID=115357 RepID=UPI001E27738B|nr:fatty acid synthase-like [Harmonia axyridis]
MMPGSSEKMNGYAEKDKGNIVITGLSGRFPESNNVDEFRQQLLDGIDMITNDPRRWPAGLHGLPERFGRLKNLTHFDAQYFGVHAKQAEQMDPQVRILLEVTHEAIVDAGYNPNELRGSKCGVFIANCASESQEFWEMKADEVNGYGLTGCSRSMFANRISYAFDFKGPSFTIDTACSSSLYAFAQAMKALETGECDSAIVGGANLLLKPNSCLHFSRLGMLSPEGQCKAFDAEGNGYVRSESVAVIFIQKANVARRSYASVLGIKTNSDGYKDLGITYPSGKMQLQLIKEIYAETGIDPNQIDYIEAHGTGTKAGDPQELNAIAEFFCKNRKNPLLIGSVKSNMGHSEAASALCSIAKMIVAMEAGFIPTNLHYKNPNPDIPSLSDGRLKVVTEKHPWEGGTVAINSFGFGGANAHIILHSNPKTKVTSQTKNIQRVIGVSGRTEEAVEELLKASEENSNDEEFLALIDQIHRIPTPGHNFRGYTILDGSNIKEINPVPPEKRPIWFVYTGMGSQWPAMAKDLMRIEQFRDSIKKSAEFLKPRGIDLEDLIVNGSNESFDNVINAYVAITAIQIAFTDILKMLKIEPDGMIGHSFGEVGCAYADGCLTAEEAILCNLERGVALIESNSPQGSMASVGLSWKDAKERCPPLVYPSCHNSKNNVTISGEPKEMKRFMKTLESEDIFVREVNSAGFAFHCRHIAKAAPILQKSLGNIISQPRPRSSKWVSTSVPQAKWHTSKAQFCSADYFVNNLLSPVLFQEGVGNIPQNALVIEIAPTGLFQNILKKSIGSECVTVSLSRKDHKNNYNFFLAAIGKIYAAGAQPYLNALYKSPSFPVGRGTPMISPHIKWDHSIEWTVASFLEQEQQSGQFFVEIDLAKEENKFMLDHIIDGRIIYPGAGYLVLVWQVFAKTQNKEYEKMPVLFEDIQWHRITLLVKGQTVKFSVNIFKSTGAFELCEGGSLVQSGKISVLENMDKIGISKFSSSPTKTDLPLLGEDIYKDLLLRGYEYGHNFKGIIKSNNAASEGEILWCGKWSSFLDKVFQFTVIDKDVRELYLPTGMEKIILNPIEHMKALQYSSENALPVILDKETSIVKCGGIEARGFKAALSQRKLNQRHPKLEKYQFIPYHYTKKFEKNLEMNKTDILTVLSHIILENCSDSPQLKMNEVILDFPLENALAPALKKILESEPLVSVDSTVITFGHVDTAFLEEYSVKHSNTMNDNLHFAVCHSLVSQKDIPTLKTISNSIEKGGFLLVEEKRANLDCSYLPSIGLQVVSSQYTAENTYLLLRKIISENSDRVIIDVSYKNFSWLQSLKDAMGESGKKNTKVYLYSNENLNGLVGLVNALRKEPTGKNVRSILIQDRLLKPFSINDHLDQLKKGLVHNVFKDGAWGSYRHLMLENVEKRNEKLVSHATINTLTRGDLASLRWIESPLSKGNSDGVDICHIYYASLNFRDIMLATGKLPPDALPKSLSGQENILGMEFAGRDSKGERIMGLSESRSLATTVQLSQDFLWKVPDKWSLEEAATIPVVYSTAYYALVMRAQLQPGESVLIHAGSGGVGIASISLALHMGCKVYTTVSSQIKRDFLKKRFPALSDQSIGYSRDTSFEQFILSETHGRGVDVVLNSLAKDQLFASVRCLANNGRFLEIGKVDLSNNSRLGLNVFLKNISFHGILVDALFEPKMRHVIRKLVKLVAEGIENGAVQPLPATVFNEDQIEEAFRYMAAGKHIGKVVIKIREEEAQKIVIPKPKMVPAIPRAYMNGNKSYILVGGLGAFGLELTNWLVNRGATKILLTSRTGVKTGYQAFRLRKLRQRGIQIVVSTEDVTTEEGARCLIECAKTLGPVGGIFNLAAVLKDCCIENQTEEKFKICCQPKVAGTIQLDKVSRDEKLDYFVTFSSITCGRGNSGQSNYAFANSAMERICEDRKKSGYPGLAIQWGPIGDVGMAMKLIKNNDTEVAGLLPQRMSSCLASMDVLLEQTNAVVSSFVLADSRHSRKDDNSFNLIDTLANILGIKNKKNWPPSTSLSDLGMDSLMAAEIKHTLERNFDIMLNAAEIRNLTLNKLIEFESKVKTENGSSNISTNGEKQRFQVEKLELMPRETIVKISKEKVGKNKSPLFIIHPIEGHVESLVGMVKHIDAPVYGLQCTADAPLDSIEVLAKFYLKHIKTVQPIGPYTIVGYSFGASVAFEMAIQLEKEGEKVKLWFLDGSPSYVSVHLVKQRISKSIEGCNMDVEQSETLVFFMTQFKEFEQQKVVDELMALPTWEQRLSRSMKMLSKMTSLPENQLNLAASSFFHRLQAADKYKPSTKFCGPVRLLKATQNELTLGKDYGLSEICKQEVKMDFVEGNHTSILTGATAEKIAKLLQVDT